MYAALLIDQPCMYVIMLDLIDRQYCSPWREEEEDHFIEENSSLIDYVQIFGLPQTIVFIYFEILHNLVCLSVCMYVRKPMEYNLSSSEVDNK